MRNNGHFTKITFTFLSSIFAISHLLVLDMLWHFQLTSEWQNTDLRLSSLAESLSTSRMTTARLTICCSVKFFLQQAKGQQSQMKNKNMKLFWRWWESQESQFLLLEQTVLLWKEGFNINFTKNKTRQLKKPSLNKHNVRHLTNRKCN